MKIITPDYLASIPTSGGVIDQGLLDIDNKERSNLFAWNGQFSPQLVEVLLETYASKDATVLDVFAGSGTVLYECGRGRLRGVAAEINPAAFYMTVIYTFINLPPSERTVHIENFEMVLAPLLTGSLSLWAGDAHDDGITATKQRLVDLRHGLSPGWERILADALIVIADFHSLEMVANLAKAWNKLKLIVEGLPYSAGTLNALNCDARNLPIPQDSVDLVITSPPYINVFNYHQQYRGSAEALGWDLLAIAKSEMGSNRKHRGNRFLTVIQYCLDITMALSEISRVCRRSARIVFVVGRESTVRGVRFFNGEIVGRLASACTSLRVDFRQERSFRNRFGDLIVEDILHFGLLNSRKHSDLFNLSDARAVAGEIMGQRLKSCTDPTAIADMTEALDMIGIVQPSPIFRAEETRRIPATN
jgi:DNA methylase